MSDRIDTDRWDVSITQPQLDALVVTIELPLISIVQGVALSFRADQARAVLVSGPWSSWPSVVTGLLSLLWCWSRSLIHTLTVSRWPLECGPHCLYMACTLVETVTCTQLTQPLRSSALNALCGVTSWAVCTLDLRMRRRRRRDSAGPTGSQL